MNSPQPALSLAKKYVKESLEGAGALKGADGKDAYEVAVEEGFTGTRQEWLDSLKGSPETLLSDDTVSENSTWSSSKISEELRKIYESIASAATYSEIDNDSGGKTVTITE